MTRSNHHLIGDMLDLTNSVTSKAMTLEVAAFLSELTMEQEDPNPTICHPPVAFTRRISIRTLLLRRLVEIVYAHF